MEGILAGISNPPMLLVDCSLTLSRNTVFDLESLFLFIVKADATPLSAGGKVVTGVKWVNAHQSAPQVGMRRSMVVHQEKPSRLSDAMQS